MANVKISKRLANLDSYVFAEVRESVRQLEEKGIKVIDFGVGDPTEPTPEIVRNAIKLSVDKNATSGYPSYVGASQYREAIASWTKCRFNVELNPETEICSSIGSKEIIFNFPEAFVDPGDVVLIPNPAYPPYIRGTQFAEGHIHYMNLLPENNFLPDLNAIPSDVIKKIKILWINYPNNPTGATASPDFFKRVVEFGQKRDIIIASDEAYTENYCDEAPHSILEISKKGVVVFQSLSKRSCMTGYRVGWVAGDKEIISAIKNLKTNIDSGTPTFIQDAAITALSDEVHVKKLREVYRKKREIITNAFVAAGLSKSESCATLYIWQKIPDGFTSIDFAKRLLQPDIAVVVTPGSLISENTKSGNPGEGFVRLALTPNLEQCSLAAERVSKLM